MKTIKKLKPGMKGTKKLVEEYGDRFVCARYRNDYLKKKRLKTIELIIDEKPLVIDESKPPMNKMMSIAVKYGEVDIGKMIRSAGGRWDRNNKVWELPYSEVLALGLENRIVSST